MADLGYLKFITNLNRGTCSGCKPGVSNISGDIINSVRIKYTREYNLAVDEGEDISAFDTPDQIGEFIVVDKISPEPEPIEKEECFIFANIFRMQGSTAQGAPPQQKVLVSSGKISCESAEALKVTGHIIEEIEEGAVAPPEIAPVTPQAPFFIQNGVKVQITPQDAGRTIKITIKENLGFREV